MYERRVSRGVNTYAASGKFKLTGAEPGSFIIVESIDFVPSKDDTKHLNNWYQANKNVIVTIGTESIEVDAEKLIDIIYRVYGTDMENFRYRES